MSGKRYTVAEKLRLTARAEKLRDEGLDISRAAIRLGVNPKTLWRWVRPRSQTTKPARVGWDPLAKCWRIYVYHATLEDDPQIGIRWWPLSWLRFATQEVAEAHLERHGEYKPEAAA